MAGRERILLDCFYNELSANPTRIDEQTRDLYAALYARSGAIHNAFSGQFAAFAQDAIDNQELLAKGKLAMPVWRLVVIIPMAPALRQKLPLPQPMCAAS